MITDDDKRLLRRVTGYLPQTLEAADLYEAVEQILSTRAIAEYQEYIALRGLVSSLAINPAIPYEIRAMMRTELGEPPLAPQPTEPKRRGLFR